MTSPPFDYDASAEIYPSRARGSRRHPVGYKRFDSAAEALQFAIEQLPAEALVGAYLEIGEERYDAREMRALYDAPAYPLPRNPPAPPPTPRRYARRTRPATAGPDAHEAHHRTVTITFQCTRTNDTAQIQSRSGRRL